MIAGESQERRGRASSATSGSAYPGQIERAGERALQQPFVAQAGRAAMLGQLLVVDRQDEFATRAKRSLRQLAQDGAALLHDPPRHLHLRLEFGIRRG